MGRWWCNIVIVCGGTPQSVVVDVSWSLPASSSSTASLVSSSAPASCSSAQQPTMLWISFSNTQVEICKPFSVRHLCIDKYYNTQRCGGTFVCDVQTLYYFTTHTHSAHTLHYTHTTLHTHTLHTHTHTTLHYTTLHTHYTHTTLHTLHYTLAHLCF